MLSAQTIDETLKLAAVDVELNNLETAIKKYQRVALFANSDIDAICYSKLGEIYRLLGDYQLALQYFNLAKYNTNNPQDRSNIIFEQIATLILSGQTLLAKVELLQLSPTLLDEATQKRRIFYQGIIEFSEDNFTTAKALFEQLIPLGSDQETKQLQLDFEALEKVYKKSPKTAKVLSIILPGLGQLYAGDFKNAANSFLLNGLILALFLDVAQSTSLVNGLLSFTPIFYRYYQGGFQTSQEIIFAKRIEAKTLLLQHFLYTLSKEY